MRTIRRPLAVMLIGAMTMSAMALTGLMKNFNEYYGIKPGSKIATAKCSLCHIGTKGPKLNAFGLDIKKIAGPKPKKLTPEILEAVGKLDSTGDGVSNAEKIKADQLPGEAKK